MPYREIDVHVGRRILLRRVLFGLTQQELAARIGVSFQQVQKYERGANRISASRLYDIASFLKTPVAFFFDDMPHDVRQAVVHTHDDPAQTNEALALIYMFNRAPAGIQEAIKGILGHWLPLTKQPQE